MRLSDVFRTILKIIKFRKIWVERGATERNRLSPVSCVGAKRRPRDSATVFAIAKNPEEFYLARPLNLESIIL